jgi:hypothetical protein
MNPMVIPGKTDRTTYVFCFLLLLGTGCSNPPGKSYSVEILSISKPVAGTYCTYNIKSTSQTDPCLPRDFLIDACEKYKVGEVVVIEMAKGSQWRECP